MSAPALWVAVPILVGGIALLALSDRAAALAGCIVCALLALVALAVPIDEALLIGPLSVKISSSASLLGRSLVIPSAEAPLLALLFGLCSVWCVGAQTLDVGRRLIPAGLPIMGLLVASIAVQPFLYAALLIELAALAAIPLLVAPDARPGRAVVKFLIYQTLGMPCILMAGWLLAGVEASPGDLALTLQATVMLALGFSFLLAVFPLSDWIPGVIEQGHPYLSGFLLWLLPNIILIFGLSFLDGFSWLRSSDRITAGLRVLGLIMLVSGGISASLEWNLKRMMGHAVVAETGLIVIAMGLVATGGPETVFAFFVPRGIGMVLWALALGTLHSPNSNLDLLSLKATGRTHPWASAGIVLSAFSAAGLPLLAGFPARIDLWTALATASRTSAMWFFLGLAGLMTGAVRQLSVLLGSRGEQPTVVQETFLQRGLLGGLIAALVALGVFPRAVDFVVAGLPAMLEHLGR